MDSNNSSSLNESSNFTRFSIGTDSKEMAEKFQKLEDMVKKLMDEDGSNNGILIGWKIGEKFGKMKKEMNEMKDGMAKLLKEFDGLKQENGELKEEMAKMKKKMEEMKEIVDELKAAKDEEERRVAEIQEYHKRMQEEAEENNSVGEVDQEEEAVAMEQDQNAKKKDMKIQLKKGANNFSKIKRRCRRPPLKSYYCVTTIDGSEKLQDASTGELVSFSDEDEGLD